MANDLPIALVEGPRAHSWFNDVLLYFLDEHAYPPEIVDDAGHAGVWVAGDGRADIIMRSDWRIDHLRMTVESPVPTVFIVSAGAAQVRVPLTPDNPVTFDLPASGVRDFTSYAYLLSARSTEGFTEHLRNVDSKDYRNLGALMRFTAIPAGKMSAARDGYAGLKELGLVVLAAALLTAVLTYPVAFQIGRVGRVDKGDGQLSIWNVAWVARTLVVDPLHVFDANIFYPHRGTLAYSENNLGAGALAVPAYWLTRNPYAAHNFVMLLAFVLSATGMYYLVRYLTDDRRAAVVPAIAFAFCPYVFAHTAHIQLLMTAGLPFSVARVPPDGRQASRQARRRPRRGDGRPGHLLRLLWRLRLPHGWLRDCRHGHDATAVERSTILAGARLRRHRLGGVGDAGVSPLCRAAAGRWLPA